MERKRFLAVVMTVMMVISMIPSMVFAAAPSGELGGKLKIKGLAAVGVVVSADYAKVTPEEVTDEDFTFSWSRQTGEKELTQVGTEKTYTITQDDLGCRLVLDLTPVDGSGLTGTLTAKTLEVAATEEEAKAEDHFCIGFRQKRQMEQRMHSWKKQQIMQKAVRILKIRTQIEQKMYSRMQEMNRKMDLRTQKVSRRKQQKVLMIPR